MHSKFFHEEEYTLFSRTKARARKARIEWRKELEAKYEEGRTHRDYVRENLRRIQFA